MEGAYNKRPEDRPKCPECGKLLSPAGGTLDGSEMFWVCWDCDYRQEDIPSYCIKKQSKVKAEKFIRNEFKSIENLDLKNFSLKAEVAIILMDKFLEQETKELIDKLTQCETANIDFQSENKELSKKVKLLIESYR